MDKYWIFLISISVIATSHLAATQDADEKEELELPPLITADQKDIVYFKLDEDEIKLDCAAEGSQPIEYLWEQIRFNDDGDRERVRNLADEPPEKAKVVGSSMVIDVGQITDEGLYQCTASNEYGVTLSKIVQVARTYLRKPKKSREPKQYEAIEGAHFHIRCDESKSFPQVSYSWVIKDQGAGKGTPVQTSERVVVSGDGSLHFAYVTKEDEHPGKFYQCEQYNPVLKIRAGGSLNSLSVDGPAVGASKPHLVYQTALEGDRIVLGRHTRIQCIFSGNPTPTVQWTFRRAGSDTDEPVPAVLQHPVLQGHPDMTTLARGLGKFLGEDEMAPPPEGTLTCTGSNSEGEASQPFTLKIEYPPRLAAAPSGRRVQEEDEVIIVCGADGNPKPTVNFLINGNVMKRDDPGHRRHVDAMPMNWKPYTKENSEQLVLTISGVCRNSDDESCDGGQDVFSIQCNASNIHGSVLGSGFVSVYEKPEGADEEENLVPEYSTDPNDPNACKDPEVLKGVDACKETYQDAVKEKGLCLAYCYYNICVTDMKLECNPPSIGDRSFCDGLCIEKGLMEEPKKPGDDDKGLSKKVITIICVIVLVLILLLLLFVLYKIHKKRQQRKKYKGVSTVYKPTTEA